MAGPYRDGDLLGPLIQEHRHGGGVLAIAMVVLFAVMGIWMSRWGWWTLSGLLAVLSFAFAAVFAAGYWLDAGTQVLQHERGLVYRYWRGQRTLLWSDVESIRSLYVVKSGIAREYHWLRARGEDARSAIPLGHGLRDLEQLMTAVHLHTDELLLGRAREAIESGGRAGFGPLWGDREGLHGGDEVVAWELVDLGLDRGMLSCPGLTGEVRAADVENLFALLRIATERKHPG